MAYKILVADDEKDALEFMQKKLIKDGFDIVTACDGKEALDLFFKENPDVVILDIMMPQKNGFEVLKEIREKSSKWRPVIIVSAKGELENIKKGYDLEADHYLVKPFDMVKLLKGIKMMIDLASLRKQENQ